MVGSPAYSPRTSGPLALPADASTMKTARQSYLKDGSEGTTQMADLLPVTSSEAAGSSSSAPTASAPAATSEQPSSAGFALPAAQGGLVALWDSGWPTGRYYWTIIPVNIVKSGESGLVYRDAELPQEACAAGRIGSFGKESDPVLISEQATALHAAEAPFASGLSTDGQLISASKLKPTFYGTPLVAWRPALGAAAYEVQSSRTLYPWRAQGKSIFTFGTSTLLSGSSRPLTPGTWYYRVRGLDPYVPGPAKEMSWSTPVQVLVAKPKYVVVGKPTKSSTK